AETVNNSIKHMWPTEEGILDEINRECKAHGARLVLLRMPFVGGYENPVELALLNDWAKSAGVPLIDEGKDVRARFDKAQQAKLFLAVGHLSSKGHQVVSDELFSALSQNELLPK